MAAQRKDMTVLQQLRLEAIRAACDRRMTQKEAAQRLALSVRQVKRLCRSYRERGDMALAPRQRGLPGNRRIDAAERERALALVRRHCPSWGPAAAAEYLRAHHGYGRSTETLRQWMISARLWKPRSRREAPTASLPRREGERVWIVTATRQWFEPMHAAATLIACVDEATGRWLHGEFAAMESELALLRALRGCVSRHGRPLTCCIGRGGQDAAGLGGPSWPQLGRALHALDIAWVRAASPSPIEPGQPGHALLADMARALRASGVGSLRQGNALLTGIVARGGPRPAPDGQPAYLPLARSEDSLRRLCSEQHSRTLSDLLSCTFGDRLLVVDARGDTARRLRGATVIVCHDGAAEPMILYRGKPLRCRIFERAATGLARLSPMTPGPAQEPPSPQPYASAAWDAEM
ncbi:MAG: helix-turn-helix domain-containing protein [Lautropia sp.]